jgi:hypothetical protein
MAGIPPNWLGSIVQGQGAQAHASERKARETATAPAGAGSFAERLQDVIEAADRDSQVYSDAEGTGSTGRPFDGGDEEAPPDEHKEQDDAGSGLDVQA